MAQHAETMKASYCSLFFLLLLGRTVTVTAAASLPPQNPCYPDVGDGGGGHAAGLACNERFSKLYSIFKMLEDQLIKDELALFSLHQGMYATSFGGTPSFDAAANQVNYFHACVRVNVTGETSMLNFTDRESLGFQNGTRCYWLQWTSSWLFSHITVDQLMIFDNVLSKLVYDPYIGHTSPRTTDLRFHLTLNDSTGVISDEELEMAVMLLCSKVTTMIITLKTFTFMFLEHTPTGVSFLFFPLAINRQSLTQSITGGPHITTLKQSVMCQEVTHVL